MGQRVFSQKPDSLHFPACLNVFKLLLVLKIIVDQSLTYDKRLMLWGDGMLKSIASQIYGFDVVSKYQQYRPHIGLRDCLRRLAYFLYVCTVTIN